MNTHPHLMAIWPQWLNARASMKAAQPAQQPQDATGNGIAIINIAGPVTKGDDWFFGGVSSVDVRGALAAAVASADVGGILLHIDSPGGTVAGTKELADDVHAADKIKPVFTFASDLIASAAYWIGSQARRLTANATAEVGSIGTYAVVVDWSEAAMKDGVKVHVISTGGLKGAGVPGTPITPEMIEDMQGRINDVNEFFLAGVRRGRKMSAAKVAGLADGRVMIAAKAQEAGLIDGVETFADAVDALKTEIKRERRAEAGRTSSRKAASVAAEAY